MSDPKLDEDLRAYLAHDRAEKAKGHTIANLQMAVYQFDVAMRKVQARTDAHELTLADHESRLDQHGMAIVALKRRNRQGPHDEEMSTGQFDVAAIQRQVAEQERQRRESMMAKAAESAWWKRSIITWVVGGIGVVAMSLLTALVTLAIANHNEPRPAAPIVREK
jgi:hypothetical protein